MTDDGRQQDNQGSQQLIPSTLSELTRPPHVEANARLLRLNAVKGHGFVQKPYSYAFWVRLQPL